MMKFLTSSLLAITVMMGLTLGAGSSAKAQVDPWPFGTAMPFPWANIQGLWEGTSESSKVLYSFKVVGSGVANRQLRVLQLDPETLEVMAEGVGFEDQKVVKAFMIADNGVQYVLTVRKVREKKKRPAGVAGVKVVLTIATDTLNSDLPSYTYVLEKISDFPQETREKKQCPLNNLSTNGEKFD